MQRSDSDRPGRSAAGAATFDALARAAVEDLPEPFRRAAREIAIRIEEMPPPDILRDMGMTDPLELTGLYEGIPLTEKSVFDQPLSPDTIWLFRAPILAEWRARGDISLGQLVAHVLVHELAHHFGWSDADIARIDRWWE